jgi:hypothetical protein
MVAHVRAGDFRVMHVLANVLWVVRVHVSGF